MKRADKDDRLARALRRTREAFVAVGLFSLVLNLLYLVSPLYMLQVYDRVLASGRYETLLYLTLIAIVALVALGLLDGLRLALLSRIGTWLQTRLGPDVLAAGIRASRTPNGQGAQPLRDLQTLQGFVGSPAITPFFDAPWTPIFVAIVWLLHPWLGIFTLAVAVLLFGLAVVNDVLTRRRYADGADNGMRVMRDAEQFHAHSETVEALGMLEAIQDRWSRRHAEGQRQLSRTADTSSWISSLTRFIRLAAQVGVLGIGAYLVLEAQLSTGGMIAASILLGRAVAPVEQSTSAWRGFSSARLALRRLRALMDAHASRPEPMRLPEPKGHLAVESLTIRAPGSARLILNAVSLAVTPGEIVAIVGPSASGKSTLCRTIVGVVPPSAGVVRLDGADVATWPRTQLGQAVGYLPQAVELFDGTVRENIARMGDSDPDEVVAAARMADVHDMILRLPAGYDTRIGPGGELLSGGQRQRIALARALFRDPKLIVLDEPNASLDQAGDLALITSLKAAKTRGAAVLLVAHGQHVLSVADKILVLVNGSIDLFDTRDAVVKIMQERQRFASAQAAKVTTASETG